jgi:hypothetical protein
MLTLAKLRRKPRHFQRFTGMSVSEFDTLLEAFTPAYEAALHQQRTQSERKRRVGAGHPFALAVAERLLVGLLYLRLYTTQSLLSLLFDLDESNISRELSQRVLPVLLAVLPAPLRDTPGLSLSTEADAGRPSPANRPDKAAADAPAKPRKRVRTLAELLALHPELGEVLLDATEQPTPQPEDKQARKLRFSGKQKTHTVKTQIVATKTQILHVCGGLPGSVADITLLRGSGVLRALRPGTRVRADKGYVGVNAPDVAMCLPIKARRKQPLNALQRAYNYALSVLRMPVEHHFARLKKHQCLARTWRGRLEQHEAVFCVVAGLCNFRQTGRLTLA